MLMVMILVMVLCAQRSKPRIRTYSKAALERIRREAEERDSWRVVQEVAQRH